MKNIFIQANMKILIYILLLTILCTMISIGSNGIVNSSSSEIFRLIPRLSYTYDYYSEHSNSSLLDGVTDLVVDSGAVEYIVHDSTTLNDTTTIWNIEERQAIQHRVHHIYLQDTIYWSYDTTYFILTEKRIGFHEIIASSLVWHFPFIDPLKSHSVYRFTDCSTTLISGHWNVNTPDCGDGIDSLWFSVGQGYFRRESYFSYGYCHNTHLSGSTKIVLHGNPVVSIKDSKTIPFKVELKQNYPNPFNPSTVIGWQLSVSSRVVLKIYDILGKEIAVLVNEEQFAGKHTLAFNAEKYKMSSGVYLLQMRVSNKNSILFSQTKKLSLVK